MVLEDESSSAPPFLQCQMKESSQSAKPTSFSSLQTKVYVYLGFVGLGSPEELGMQCALRRLVSTSQGMSLVKRLLGKALRKAGHTLVYVVILFLKEKKGERFKNIYHNKDNIFFPMMKTKYVSSQIPYCSG